MNISVKRGVRKSRKPLKCCAKWTFHHTRESGKPETIWKPEGNDYSSKTDGRKSETIWKAEGNECFCKKELRNPETLSNAMGNEHFTKQGDPGNQKPFENLLEMNDSSENGWKKTRNPFKSWGELRFLQKGESRWIGRIGEIQKTIWKHMRKDDFFSTLVRTEWRKPETL